MLKKIFHWFKNNSLWVVGFGLMLASSGLDGAYMSQWMTKDLWFLGYVLNTVSDIAGMILIYWYGIFQQSNDEKKKLMSKFLLSTDIVSVVYSWFFSWRQLRFMIPAIETNPITGSVWEIELVSFISAGFIPLTLAFVGYAQSISEKPEETKEEETATKEFLCWCGKSLKNKRSYKSHLRMHKNEALTYNNAETAYNALQSKYEKTIPGASIKYPSLDTFTKWFEPNKADD